MIEYDDYLYYYYVKSGINYLIEMLEIRLKNEPDLIKERKILNFIIGHKYGLEA